MKRNGTVSGERQKRRKRRRQILAQALAIVLFALAPSYAGGGGGGGGCSQSPTNIASEVADSFEGEAPPVTDLAPIVFHESLDSDSYIERLLSGASNRFDARLPGYSYFQGVGQAYNHILVAGQVRVVGGILGADAPNATASFYQGAMVTTNAHAFFGAGKSLTGGGDGVTTRIRSWRIVAEEE